MAISLVTGGAGFIGSHVVSELLNKGHTVIILDDLSGGFKENIPTGAMFVEGSINDTTLVEKIFSENKIDYVFHLAAYAAEGLSHFIRKFNYENNLVGSINLINESVKNKIKCFVFTSSIAVYGKNQVPMTEGTIPMPEDPYGVSKFAVELDLKCAREIFGLNYIIFRPHNVYGENQNIGDKYRNVVGIFMNQIMQGLPLSIFGDGTQKRAFSYIGDVAPIIANSVNTKEAYNQVFNIGADIPYTVNELAREVCVAMGVNENYPITHLPPRNEVVNAYSSHEKVQKVFNYSPSISLSEGLKKQADWAKKVGSKKSKEFDNIEIIENLPPSWAKRS